MEEKDNSRYILQSVQTAFSILDLFIDHDELQPAEITNLTGMNRSKAFRFLVTLEQCGYISKSKSGGYRLSPKVSTLGQLAQNRSELISLIHPQLEVLSEQTGESAHLNVMHNKTQTIFIDKCLGSLYLRMDLAMGYTSPAHVSACGKAMLSTMSNQDINYYIMHTTFQPRSKTSVQDAKDLLERLTKIREQGYAVEIEEAEDGLSCISVPILSGDRAICAISVSGPTTRIMKNKEHIKECLFNSKAIIEKSL